MRYADLSAHAGKTVQDVQVVNDACSAAGAFWSTFTDIAIASEDGSVRPIYNRQKSMTLSVSCDSGVTDCWQIIGHPAGIGWAYHTTTTYYHGDHLGSSRFLSSYNGTPMWEATYLPYGQEWNPPSGAGPVSPNHYKFTGKERDPESGLDYFGARYYASAHGRFLSPDWSPTPVPVPYANPTNPQSLNIYAYVGNNPITYLDEQGHYWIEAVTISGKLFYRAARESNTLGNRLGSRAPWVKLIDLSARQQRGDTNTPRNWKDAMLGNIVFLEDQAHGVESPEKYSYGEAIEMDEDVFSAFAKEFGLVEQDRGATTTMLLSDRQQAQELGQFHTAYRYGQEIKRLEQKLEKTTDPKKKEKIQQDIEKRKNSKEFKKFGKRVQKYVDGEAK